MPTSTYRYLAHLLNGRQILVFNLAALNSSSCRLVDMIWLTWLIHRHTCALHINTHLTHIYTTHLCLAHLLNGMRVSDSSLSASNPSSCRLVKNIRHGSCRLSAGNLLTSSWNDRVCINHYNANICKALVVTWDMDHAGYRLATYWPPTAMTECVQCKYMWSSDEHQTRSWKVVCGQLTAFRWNNKTQYKTVHVSIQRLGQPYQ